MHVVVLTQGIVWYSYGNIDHKLLKLDYNTPKNQHPNVVEQNGEWNGLSIMLCPCKMYINGDGQNPLFRLIFLIDRVCGKIWFWPVVSMLMRTVLHTLTNKN